ncbi:MAG: DPP IV N-terminal domain-containing protein, partial [Gemmatimonadaceae bacterium]
MRKALFALLITVPLAAQTPSTFDFSIRNIMRGPELYGRQPQDVRWSADNKWIYFTWLEPGSAWQEAPKRFRVKAEAGAKPERVSPAAFDSVGAFATVGERSANGRLQAVEYNGDIYVTDMLNGSTRRLTQTNARETDPHFSKDGSKVYYISSNNVFSIDRNGGLVRQLTDLRSGPAPADSVPPTGQRGRIEKQQRDLFEVIRDQVRADSIAKAARKERESRGLKPYYTQRGEELAGVSPSPDANSLLITTHIPATARGNEIPRFVTQSGYTEQIKGRDNVGDVQDKGRVGFLNLMTGILTWLKPFPADTADGFALPLGWSGDGRFGAFYGFTADNKVRVLRTVDAATGKLTTLETLRDSAWVGGPCGFGCAGWYDNGRRFYYVSEATGFAHLYSVAADGSDRKQLTSGKWEVLDVHMSPDEKTFYLQTNEPGAAEEQFYTMSVNGGARDRVTTKSGRHRVVVSPNGKMLADVYSFVNRPPDLFLMPNKAGSAESQLTVSPSKEWLSFNWIAP